MKFNLIPIISRMTIIALAMNFASCKVLKQNESTAIPGNSDKPLIVFLNCSISYDSIGQEYNMDMIDKTITEGRIKKPIVDSDTYEEDDFKYCLLDKNKQIISIFYMKNPLNKTIEYVDENGLLKKKSINLDSAPFSLRIQLTSDSKYVRFEKDNKQLLTIDLNIK